MQSDMNLGDLLSRAVDLYPDSIALRCGEREETYEEFYNRVLRLGTALMARGIEAGDRICVLSPNCHRIVELYWALALLGASAVPLEPRLTSSEISGIIEATSPKAVVTASWEAIDPSLKFSYLKIDSVASGTGNESLDDLITSNEKFTSLPTVPSNTPVLIMYTAAVTGQPKGAVLTHRNIISQVSQTGEAFGLTPADSYGLILPLSHTFGAYLMFVASARGVPTTVLPSFDAAEVVRRIELGQISFFAEFAPMGQRILDAALEAKVNLRGKLRVVTALEVPDTIARYVAGGIAFYCLYGQTETSGIVSTGRVDPTSAVVANYTGKALSLSRLQIHDEQGNLVSNGEPGELWVRGDCVVNRYWPNEPTNLNEDGWLRTGDLLGASDHGDLYFYGRVSARDLMKPGGLNVYPAEVEQVLLRHPKVAAVYVFGAPDPVWREKIVAVVCSKGAPEDGFEAELMSFAQEHLASFKRPKVIILDQDLMVTGKVDPQQVRLKYNDL